MKAYIVFTVGFTFLAWVASAQEQILFESTRDANDEIYRHFPGVRTERLTFDEGGDYDPALSPDGTKMAYVTRYGGNLEVAVMELKSSKRRLLTFSPGGDSNLDPTWSPDGSQIAFASDRNGEFFDIYIMDADGTNVTNMTDSLRRDDVSPDWSPVSQKIVFTSSPVGSDDEVYLLDVNTRTQRRLATASTIAANPKWSPKASRIAYLATEWPDIEMLARDTAIWRVKADGTNLEALVTTGETHLQPTYSPDGRWIAFASDRDSNMDIYTLNLETQELTRLTTHVGYDSYPDWSPDGEQIAFMSIRDGNPDVFTVTVNRAHLTKLTNSAMAERRPSWSSDGEKIAFSRKMADESTRIFVIDSNGGNEVELVDFPFSNDYPTWSPKGKKIAFVNRPEQGNRKSRIWTVDPDGENFQVLYEDPDELILEIAWSSDGTQIVFSQTRGLFTFLDTATLEVRTIETPVDVPTGLNWSPNGQDIVFTGSRRIEFEMLKPRHGLFIIDSDGNPVHAILMDTLSSTSDGFAWSPDGNKILFGRGDDLNTLDLDSGAIELFIKTASHPDWQDPSRPRSVSPRNKLNTMWCEMKQNEKH